MEAELPRMAKAYGIDLETLSGDAALEACEQLQKQTTEASKKAVLQARALPQPKTHSDDLSALIGVLNTHLETLQWADRQSSLLEEESKKVGKLADTVEAELKRGAAFKNNSF